MAAIWPTHGALEQRELLSMFRGEQNSHNGTENSTQP
jgi:hypothetical protein